jgi:hypothetical protein
VSASSASPAASGSGRGVPADPVRALQHALYRAAKADPGRRFHALYDKASRRDVLWRAWVAVRRNNGAPGIDKITLAGVEEHGVDRLLGELASELREGRYRPLPARRVFIPKPGAPAGEQRPLSIPSVRDRIVQAAVKIRRRTGASGTNLTRAPAILRWISSVPAQNVTIIPARPVPSQNCSMFPLGGTGRANSAGPPR